MLPNLKTQKHKQGVDNGYSDAFREGTNSHPWSTMNDVFSLCVVD